MTLWRCWNGNCADYPEGRPGHDFEGNEPTCDKCGVAQKDQPHLITRRVLIHFDAPHPKIKDQGVGYASCQKSTKVGGTKHVAFTGDPSAVNCAGCKKSKAWKDAMADHDDEPRAHEVADFHMDLPATGPVRTEA